MYTLMGSKNLRAGKSYMNLHQRNMLLYVYKFLLQPTYNTLYTVFYLLRLETLVHGANKTAVQVCFLKTSIILVNVVLYSLWYFLILLYENVVIDERSEYSV